MLSLSDLSFSGGGNSEGSAAANSVMLSLTDDSFIGTAEGLPKPKMLLPPPRPPHLSSTASINRCHRPDDSVIAKFPHPAAGWSAGSSSGSSLSSSGLESAM
ncbi:hypothetical protein Tco_1174537 [Tanacetum coccineum]